MLPTRVLGLPPINRNWLEARQEIQARLYWGPCCGSRSENKQQVPSLACSLRGWRACSLYTVRVGVVCSPLWWWCVQGGMRSTLLLLLPPWFCYRLFKSSSWVFWSFCIFWVQNLSQLCMHAVIFSPIQFLCILGLEKSCVWVQALQHCSKGSQVPACLTHCWRNASTILSTGSLHNQHLQQWFRSALWVTPTVTGKGRGQSPHVWAWRVLLLPSCSHILASPALCFINSSLLPSRLLCRPGLPILTRNQTGWQVNLRAGPGQSIQEALTGTTWEPQRLLSIYIGMWHSFCIRRENSLHFFFFSSIR